MKLTKFALVAALLASGVVLHSPVLLAQQSADSKPAAQQGDTKKPDGAPGGQRQGNRPDRLKQMTETLGLSEEQQTKLRPILKEETDKMRELRQDTALTQEQRREKAKALRDDSEKKLKAVLTTEQFEKWQKARQERGNRPGGGQGQGRPQRPAQQQQQSPQQ